MRERERERERQQDTLEEEDILGLEFIIKKKMFKKRFYNICWLKSTIKAQFLLSTKILTFFLFDYSIETRLFIFI